MHDKTAAVIRSRYSLPVIAAMDVRALSDRLEDYAAL